MELRTQHPLEQNHAKWDFMDASITSTRQFTTAVPDTTDSVEIPEPSPVQSSHPFTDESSNSGTAPPSQSTDALWKGWAELENDPTIFNVMLREWGVKGVRVREVIPLDAIFDTSAASTYGLIFLSRYSPSERPKEKKAAPPDVWFANQTSSFSCATVALLNILNNNEHIHLGPELEHFKFSTVSLSSKDRGLALDAFDHVRKVHNSFATEIDTMNVDMRLKEDAKAAKKKRAQAHSAKKSKKRGKSKAVGDEQQENGFHFVAYIPIRGSVWKMDGMEAQPATLGTVSESDSWLAMVIPELSAQWETATQQQLEYSLLSLVVDEDGDVGHAEDEAKANRLREDWSPLIAALVRLHASKGTLEAALNR